MSHHKPDSAKSDDDVTTDPALDDGSAADWTSEGGATPAGPATDTDAEGAPEE